MAVPLWMSAKINSNTLQIQRFNLDQSDRPKVPEHRAMLGKNDNSLGFLVYYVSWVLSI